MLVLNGVSKKYFNQQNQEIKILDGVSFSLPANKITAIIGPNGCGKSTLLKIIANLEQFDSGTIDSKLASSYTTGLIFQNHRDSLFPWKTVRGNIHLATQTVQPDKLAGKASTERIIEQLGLTSHQNKYPYQLSGGLSQLTAIGRALALKPDILLLDEPFSALDYHTSVNIQKQFTDIWEQSRITTLLITHSLEEAVLLADIIVIFSPQPAKVVAIIPNSLPRPRSINQSELIEFHNLRNQILRHIKATL